MKFIIYCVIFSLFAGKCLPTLQKVNEYVDKILSIAVRNTSETRELNNFPLEDYWLKMSVIMRFYECEITNQFKVNRSGDCRGMYWLKNQLNVDCNIILQPMNFQCKGIIILEEHQESNFMMKFFLNFTKLFIKIVANNAHVPKPTLREISVKEKGIFTFDLNDFNQKGGKFFNNFVTTKLSDSMMIRFINFLQDYFFNIFRDAVAYSVIYDYPNNC